MMGDTNGGIARVASRKREFTISGNRRADALVRSGLGVLVAWANSTPADQSDPLRAGSPARRFSDHSLACKITRGARGKLGVAFSVESCARMPP